MTTIQEVIFNRTSTYPGLVPFVDTRIHPYRLPETVTYPAIRYFRVSEPDGGMTHDGDGSFGQSRFQFDVLDSDPAQLEIIGDELAKCWDGFRGVVSTINISSTFKLDRSPLAGGYDADLEVYAERFDFMFMYNRQ